MAADPLAPDTSVLVCVPGCPKHGDIVRFGRVRTVDTGPDGKPFYIVELEDDGPIVGCLDWSVTPLWVIGVPARCRISQAVGRA